jgi:hypothetical protein
LKTINNFLKAINGDMEIQNLIADSTDLKDDYRPRTRNGKSKNRSTKAGIALKYFWGSIDGVKLRYVFESKYKVNISDKRLIGALKDALLIYISQKEIVK